MDKASAHPVYIIIHIVGSCSARLALRCCHNTDANSQHRGRWWNRAGIDNCRSQRLENWVGFGHLKTLRGLLVFFENLSQICRTVQLLPCTWLCSSPSWRKVCGSQPWTRAHAKAVRMRVKNPELWSETLHWAGPRMLPVPPNFH